MSSSRLSRRLVATITGATLAGVALATVGVQQAGATAYPRSERIALVPDSGGRVNNGGTLPTSGFPDSYAPTFTNVTVESVRDDATNPLDAGYDTFVLNGVCDINDFLSNTTFKTRIEGFVSNGGKLIIWDSECAATDYSQFAIPFQTNNPGQLGANGTLVDAEENTLSSADPASSNYVNVNAIASGTDAVGDANVFTTYDPRWYIDLKATNASGVDGPVQAYANLGAGLIIYSGLDKDYMPSGSFDPAAADGGTQLNRVWLLELLQPWSPDGLPNSHPAAGKQLRYVAIGDSYSAGEGAGAGMYFQYQQRYYLCTSRNGTTREFDTPPRSIPGIKPFWTCEEKSRGVDIACHRAPTAWSFQLSTLSQEIPDWTKANPSDDVINAACSGAKINDVTKKWFKGEQPQVELLKAKNAEKPVDLVTFSIGGNDLGFSTIILDCYSKAIACDKGRVTDDGSSPARGIGLVATRIATEVIPKLRAAAPGARIAVVGYPRIMPKAGAPLVSCGHFTTTEQAAVNKFVSTINKTWKAAAEQAGAGFVDVEEALDGHELCTHDSHVNKIYGWPIPNPRNSEQGHPTASGQEDLAGAVFAGLKVAGLLGS